MRDQHQTLRAAGTASTGRFMRCVVAGTTYCLNMRWVRGIRRPDELQGRPQDDGHVGWLSHEAQDVPVLSLAARLSLPAMRPPEGGKIVLCHTSSRPWAFLVERVEGIIDIPSTDIFPVPRLARNAAAPFVESVVKYAGTMLLALSPAGLSPQAKRTTMSPSPTERPEALPTLTRVPPVPGKQGAILCFSTTDQPPTAWPLSFGLSVSQVAHMQQSSTLCPVPGAASHVLGLAEWQGYPLAVIDLSRCLGGDASTLSRDSRLLIARATTTPAFVSFPVRPQVRVCSLPLPHQPSYRSLALQAALLRGCFDLANETLVIPDIDRLLVLQEQQGC